MATETGPDLSTAVEAIEALMDDTCVIDRDPDAELDNVLDTVTGALTRPEGHPFRVYDETTTGEGGRPLGAKCKVTKSNTQMKYSQEAGRAVRTAAFMGAIPVDSPMPWEGDILTVTSSRRDSELVGLTFRVGEVVVSTFAVQRKFELELRPEGSPVGLLSEEDGDPLISEGGDLVST